ncbi:MAG: hypothetical protein GQ469_05895 [Methanosarcinales archaeon]|nr:hypothetical protein [Methanosarcinales archaeon]
MGRSKSWFTGSCAGVRVAGKDGDLGLTYLPAHTLNGKPYNQRVTFTVYVNSTSGTKPDGSPGRSDQFQFVAYGAQADAICRCLSNGKALDAIVKPHSYLGRSFNNGVMRLEADGTPVIVRKVGFQIVDSPIYGEDSQKTIDQEIATGRRPVNWNVAAHPDSATWTQMLKDRSNVQYVLGSTVFGYARVLPLTGAGVVQVAQTPTGPAARVARMTAKAANTSQPAAGAYVPPANPVPAGSTTTNPFAGMTTEQIASLVAQITGKSRAEDETTQPTTAQGVDPKTGFTEAAGAPRAF